MPTTKTIPAMTVKMCAALLDRARPPQRGVVVLLYHRIGAGTSLSVDVPTALFDEHMALLAQERRPATIDAALANLRADEIPEVDAVVVSFDDGTADFAEAALPVLVRHRVPAVLYLSTDFVERGRAFPNDGRSLSWPELRDALSTGLVTVGSHTHSHALLDRLPEAQVEHELDRSRGLVADRLGVSADHFAYPKAILGSAGTEAAVRRRFRSAALGGMRANPYGNTEVYRLARSSVQRGDGLRFFRHKLAGGMRFEGFLRERLDRARYTRATS